MTVRRVLDPRAGRPGIDSDTVWHVRADDRQHVIELTLDSLDLADVTGGERLAFRMSTDDGWRLFESLLSALRSAESSRLSDARRGECSRCGNLRFVEEGPRGETIHCPECSPHDPDRFSSPILAPIPTLLVWRADEVAVGERPADPEGEGS